MERWFRWTVCFFGCELLLLMSGLFIYTTLFSKEIEIETSILSHFCFAMRLVGRGLDQILHVVVVSC